MPAPAHAFALQFRRNLTPLIPFAIYLVAAGAALPWLIGDRRVRFGDEIAAMVMVPFSFLFFYLLAAFTFGLTGDIGARRSIYPARMFTLPLTNAALAGWPMLYGVATIASLVLLTTMISRTIWGLELPIVWPAVLGAVFAAWTQALTWMPYGIANLRVVLTVGWLFLLDAIVITAIELEISEAAMVGFLAPQLPLAYLTAVWAVARARRGEVPHWRLFPVADRRRRARSPFTTVFQAQTWLEWRRAGWSLPMLVGCVLPFIAWLVFVPGNDGRPMVSITIAAMLLTPPAMAGFAAGAGSRPNPNGANPLELSLLDATRPVTTAALVAARLRVTLVSTLLAWGLVAIAIPSALTLSGTWHVVQQQWREFATFAGTPRALATTALLLLLLIASTWKKLVQRLYIGLTGRTWIIKSSGYVALFMLIAMLIVLAWLRRDDGARVWLWEHWTTFAAALVAIKTVLAAWLAVRLHEARLVSDRVLVGGAACWAMLVLTVFVILVWMFDTPYIPRHVLLSLAILAVPLARVAAAPLALHWNRHR